MKLFILATFFAVVFARQLPISDSRASKSNLAEVTRIAKSFKSSKFDDNIQFLGDFNGKSFYIGRQNSTQLQAEACCCSHGLKLAKIETQEELDWIGTQIPENSAWTGGIAGFTDLDGTGVPRSLVNLDDAHEGLQYQHYSGPTYLHPTDEMQRNTYLCYNGATEATENDMVDMPEYIGDINGKSFYIGRDEGSQLHAEFRCCSFGLTLAKVETANEIIWIANHIDSTFAWTGGVPGFVHLDGTGIDTRLVSNPNLPHVGVDFYREGWLGQNDDRSELHYLCYNGTTTRYTAKPAMDPMKSSAQRNVSMSALNVEPEFLGNFNGKSFYALHEQKSQTSAVEGCLDLGYVLAKVETQEELDWISTVVYEDNAWTGGIAGFTHLDGTGLDSYLVLGDKQKVGLQFIRFESGETALYSQFQSDEQIYLCTGTPLDENKTI